MKELRNWSVLTALVLPMRSRQGRTGFDVGILLRAMILGVIVNSCSSLDLERTLTIRFDFILCCDLPSTDRKTDHSTLYLFRCALTNFELHVSIFEEINSLLSKLQLMIGDNEEDLSIIDATLVEAAARPRITYTVIAEDRKKDQFYRACCGSAR